MNVRRMGAFGAIVAVLSTAAFAEDTNVRLRGTIKSFDGSTLVLTPLAGAEQEITVPDSATVSATKPFSLADIKSGMSLGVTTIKRGDGAAVAVEVHPIPATARLGISPWDLAPDSLMNNGSVTATVSTTKGQELTLDYKSGSVTVLVVPETRMAQAVPGVRADLKTGEFAYVFATKSEAGKLTAARIQVSKDGVKPVQ